MNTHVYTYMYLTHLFAVYQHSIHVTWTFQSPDPKPVTTVIHCRCHFAKLTDLSHRWTQFTFEFAVCDYDFAASLLLDAQKALVITLIAVICVVYQLFLGSILEFTSLKNLTNSAILAFLFCVVYGSAQIAVKRFQLLEI